MRLLTGLFLSILICEVGRAGTVPSVSGKIENQSEFSSRSLRIQARWHCVTPFHVKGPTCHSLEKTVLASVNHNGGFDIPAFPVPSVPAGGHYAEITFSVLAPDGSLYFFAESRDPEHVKALHAVFFQLDGTNLTFRLANGRDFLAWLQTEAPQRRFSGVMEIRHPGAPGKGRYRYYQDLTSNSLSIKPYRAVIALVDGLEIDDLNMSIDLSFQTGDARLFDFKYDGPMNSSVVSGIKMINVDSSRVNTDISGVWSGSLLTRGMWQIVGFDVYDLDVELNVACIGRELSGQLLAKSQDGSYPDQVIPVSGSCHNGYYSFSVSLIFKGCRNNRLVRVPLRFKSDSVSNDSSYAQMYSVKTGKQGGTLSLGRN